MIAITVNKLNKLYDLVNIQSRQGLISKMKPHFVENDGNLIKFVFHRDKGNRGTWFVDTELEVRHIDDKDLGYESDTQQF